MPQAVHRTQRVILLALLISPARDVRAEDTGSHRKSDHASRTVIGLTSPRQRAVLAAVLPGRIARLPIAEGEMVQTGDVVISLDDAIQTWRTDMARAGAESTLEVDLARQRYERAKLDLDRLANLRGDDSASSKELRDATVAAELERISCETARFNQEQARRALELQQATLAEYRIRAPFSGYVVEHLKHAGETVDALAGILVLAELDPLQVVLDCPLALADEIRVGDRWTVQPAEVTRSPRAGVVTLVNRVADGASQTFKVKLTVDNADGEWISGMRVRVEFDRSPLAPTETEVEPGARITSPRGGVAPTATKTSYEERPR